MLIDADRFWRAVQSMLRILFGTTLPRTLDDAAAPALDALLRGVAASCTPAMRPGPGLAGLEERMGQVSRLVRGTFIRLIGEPHGTGLERSGGLPEPVKAALTD
jgi:hypothetical protein